MSDRSQSQRKRRLRKQRRRSRVRRVRASTTLPLPQVTPVPKTARRRRRRKSTRSLRSVGISLRSIVLSNRWYSVALLALCAYALYLIGTNQRYYLTRFSVEGNIALTAEDLVRTADMGGRHIFASQPDVAAERLSEIPGVLSARVITQWPNSTHIVIEEDVPELTWSENGKLFWVNEVGRFIPAGEVGTPQLHISADLPLAPLVPVEEEAGEDETDSAEAEIATTEDGAEGDEAGANDASADDPEMVRRDTFLQFVPAELMIGVRQLKDLYPELNAFDYSLAGGLAFPDPRGWYVYFGVGDNMEQKKLLYDAIVAELQESEIQPAYISVANPAKPHYYGARQ